VNGKINRYEDKLAWVPYFNAGVRVVDLSDPYNMKEGGYYIPKPNKNSYPIADGQPVAIRMNDATSIIAVSPMRRIAWVQAVHPRRHG
jgi:hypothetical protein